jgi:hypothetical protein
MIEPYKITESFEEARIKSLKPKVVVTDFDETLCYTTPVFMKLLKTEYKDKLKGFIKLNNKYSESEILYRNSYYINDWLGVKWEDMPDDLKEVFQSIWSHDNFYKMCKPSKYLIGLTEFIKNKMCNKIFIVSKCLSDKSIAMKKEFINHYFDNKYLFKIEFLPVNSDEKKSDIINKNKIIWDSLAEDKLSEIRDIVLNTQSFGNEIIINRLGYNRMTPEFERTVKLFNLQVFYLKEQFNHKRVI